MNKEKVLIVVNENIKLSKFNHNFIKQIIVPFINKTNSDYYNKVDIKQAKDYIEIETEYSIYKIKNESMYDFSGQRYHKIFIDYMINSERIQKDILTSIIFDYPESEYKYFDSYEWVEVDKNTINHFHNVINEIKITFENGSQLETIETDNIRGSRSKQLESALKEIESLTRNPREYEPSFYTINHIARSALNLNKK